MNRFWKPIAELTYNNGLCEIIDENDLEFILRGDNNNTWHVGKHNIERYYNPISDLDAIKYRLQS